MTIHCHILGFPRIGAQRELKFVLEGHSRGEVSEAVERRAGRPWRRHRAGHLAPGSGWPPRQRARAIAATGRAGAWQSRTQ